MISGGQCDNFNFSISKTGEILGIPNQIVTMEMMLRMRNEEPHIMQKTCSFQVLSIDICQLKTICQLVVQHLGKPSHLFRMFSFIRTTFS